jgi:hypothetical protein
MQQVRQERQENSKLEAKVRQLQGEKYALQNSLQQDMLA